ncbi:hypothetical protein Tco_1130225 [Tanacetum coccineum]
MSPLAEIVLAAGAENQPHMLEKGNYDIWQSRLPNDIYTLLNHKKKAYDIWYRVKDLMEGIELTKQESESNLANEFDRFTLEKGETIRLYYMRLAKLMNDINIIQLDMTKL